jgi:CTP-dependent riboflavin kinase
MVSEGNFFPQWNEERLRYQVLRFVHDQVAHDCNAALTSTQIGRALAIGESELLRIISWLNEHGYVRQIGIRPSVCMTERGIEYLENLANRRKSLRNFI